MTIRKKSKKINPKKSSRHESAKKTVRTGSSTKVSRTKKVTTALTKTTKKMVDQILLKMSPSIDNQILQLGQNLNKSPLSVDHLKLLGLRALERAKAMSAGLRTEAAKKKAAKIVKAKKVKP